MVSTRNQLSLQAKFEEESHWTPLPASLHAAPAATLPLPEERAVARNCRTANMEKELTLQRTGAKTKMSSLLFAEVAATLSGSSWKSHIVRILKSPSKLLTSPSLHPRSILKVDSSRC
jgi:hypothetical protein